MYQALYRKWRPRTFSEMAGQDAIRKTLKNQVASGRVGHAYLFCGSRGTGKTSAAKILSRAVNCLNPQNGDPCLACASCRQLEDGSSLDVFEMDAASNSRVEEIRELLEKVDYPPQFGKRKVYIIDEVHMLSNAAFNALLKTLEEPPEYMLFILATTEPQKIPATILSRCQRFDFGRLTEEQIIKRLLNAMPELHSAEPGALALIARAADGAMRDAWSLMDMCLGSGDALTEEGVRAALGTSDSAFLATFAASLADRDGARALDLVDQLMREGKDPLVFLRDFSAYIRQLAAVKLGAGMADALGADALRRAREQCERFTLGRLLQLLDSSMQSETNSRYASSPRAVLELFAMQACRQTEGADIRALQDRLEEVELALSQIRLRGVMPPSAAPQSAAPSQEAPAPVRDIPPDPPALWNQALRMLEKEAPSIYSSMQTGRYDGYDNGTFRLRLPPDGATMRDILNEESRRMTVEKMLTDTAGKPCHFLAVLDSDDAAPRTAEDNAREEQMLIETFGREKVQIDRQ